MTLSARSRPLPGAVTVALPRYPFPPPRRVAAWCQDVAARRGRSAALRGRLGFAPRERLLATGTAPGGGYALAASDRALYYRGAGQAWSRLGWEHVVRVDWEPEGRAFVVTGIVGAGPAGAGPAGAGLAGTGLAGTGLAGTGRTRAVVPLRERGDLPEVALERVAYTRLGSWRVVLPGGQPLAVTARRRPVTDEVLWFVSGGDEAPGPHPGDRQAQVRRAIARLAAEAGLDCQPAAAAPAAGRARRPG